LDTSAFIYHNKSRILEKGSVTCKAPSNIALIKYWGKTDLQLPKNSSLSFTLSACFTQTTFEFTPVTHLNQEDISFNVFFDGLKQEDFKPKIKTFFSRIEKYVPFIKDYSYSIKTHNSFPHSSGIASSASGMAALALAVMSLEKKLNPTLTDEYFYKKASFLARLGSGSAARSIKGSVVVWGAHDEMPDSSDSYAVVFPFKIHSIFTDFHDTILLVDKGQKQVSSTLGHQLMHAHPFAEQRFQQAHQNLSKLKEVLQSGAIKEFISIVESEALSLHAMMLTSKPYFVLMQPNTLAIIHKIWAFRAQTNANICFTLDAGANVHVLYPKAEKILVNKFIVEELVPYCQNRAYINDRVGAGAVIL